LFANAAGSPTGARVYVTVTRAGVIMQLAGKRDAFYFSSFAHHNLAEK